MKLAAPLARGVSSVLAVVAAIVVSNAAGDNVGKLVGAAVGAVLIFLIEWFVQWSPRHLGWARRLFDPRAVWEGVWLQVVETVTGSGGVRKADPNTCSVVRIDYVRAENGYELVGRAFDSKGDFAAKYASEKWPTFTRDGLILSYEWSGTVDDPTQPSQGVTRKGLASVRLTSAEKDHGDGLVQHVGMNREMVVTMDRLTDEYIRDELQIVGYTSTSLLDYNTRMKFGAMAAKQMAARKPAVAAGQGAAPADPASG